MNLNIKNGQKSAVFARLRLKIVYFSVISKFFLNFLAFYDVAAALLISLPHHIFISDESASEVSGCAFAEKMCSLIFGWYIFSFSKTVPPSEKFMFFAYLYYLHVQVLYSDSKFRNFFLTIWKIRYMIMVWIQIANIFLFDEIL